MSERIRGEQQSVELSVGLSAVNIRRLFGYPVAVALVGWLVWAGFVRTSEADPGTLLSSAEVHLRMAAALPEDTPKRAEFLEVASEMSKVALEQGAAMWEATQLLGYAAYLDGELETAAGYYDIARKDAGCPEKLAARLTVQCAELALRRKDWDTAEAIVADESVLWAEGSLTEMRNEIRVRIADSSGRRDEAIEMLGALRETGGISGIRAGILYEQLDCVELAAATFGSETADEPVTFYYLARLKMRQGDVDSALRLLERSLEGDDAATRVLVRDDEAEWREVAKDERFVRTMQERPDSAQPPAGR